LEAQRGSPVARVGFKGNTVEYHGPEAIEAAIGRVRAELASAEGKPRRRVIRFRTSKGIR